jgi:hypothetical protein
MYAQDLANGQSASAVTNNFGYYTFYGLMTTRGYQITPVQGDINSARQSHGRSERQPFGRRFCRKLAEVEPLSDISENAKIQGNGVKTAPWVFFVFQPLFTGLIRSQY